jgi:hypothetical protein
MGRRATAISRRIHYEEVQKMKTCSKCHRKLPATLEFFYNDIRLSDGLANPCKQCKKAYEKTEHGKNMNHWRWIKYKYGISPSLYNKLFKQQSGCCGVCARHQSKLGRRLDIDHDHKTGRVRGLLCNYCNKIIEKHINNPEYFKDPIIRKNLETYLGR